MTPCMARAPPTRRHDFCAQTKCALPRRAIRGADPLPSRLHNTMVDPPDHVKPSSPSGASPPSLDLCGFPPSPLVPRNSDVHLPPPRAAPTLCTRGSSTVAPSDVVVTDETWAPAFRTPTRTRRSSLDAWEAAGYLLRVDSTGPPVPRERLTVLLQLDNAGTRTFGTRDTPSSSDDDEGPPSLVADSEFEDVTESELAEILGY